MGNIICFVEDPKRKSVFRFISGFRKKRWFRRARIKYSFDPVDGALYDYKDEDIKDIEAKITSDYPNAEVCVMVFDEFIEKYYYHQFYVICRWNEEENEFYQGVGKDRKAMYSTDVEDARMIFSERTANETLRTIQQTTRDKVYVRPMYLNMINELLTPVMMITCTSKKSGQTKYFKKLDGNRLRLVSTSEAATKLTYDTSVTTWEYLKTHNKNFLYAVLPVFKDNVNSRDIERYMKEKNVSRMICMDLQLKHLNR